MGKVKKMKKKVGIETSKNEMGLGKQKQSVQRFDLDEELQELHVVNKPTSKKSNFKMPSVMKLEWEGPVQRTTNDSGDVSSSSKIAGGTEVSSFMKTFMNKKLQKPKPNQRRNSPAQEKRSYPKTKKGLPEGKHSLVDESKLNEKIDSSVTGMMTDDDITAVQSTSSKGLNVNAAAFFIHHLSDKVTDTISEEVHVHQHSTFKSINVPDFDQVILLLEKDEQCALKGKYQISSLDGVCEIYGYKIAPKTGWCSVYSADNASHIVIRARLDDRESHKERVNAFFTENGLKKQLALLTDQTCVFLLQELTDPMCDTVTSMQPFKKLFTSTVPDSQSNLSLIGVSEVDAQDRVLRIGDQFLQLSKHFRHAVKETRGQKARAPALVLAGGSNVGKSTLCRYMINSVLNCSDTVMFLECDIGQTEVTPPGCVSLSMIRKPLLGPPFTHLHVNHPPGSAQSRPGPIRQYFCGHVSPSDDPAHYIGCLQQTIRCYHDNYSHLPLIVNTMGWNQGLGLMLMLDTLKMVCPSFLAQIKSTNEHRNYPALSPQYVKQNKGWRRDLKSPADLDYKRFVIDSLVSQSDVQKLYSPADNRDLALLAYLCGRLENPRTSYVDLFGLVPFLVPWHAVGVRVVHTAVPHQHVMGALNASVVGLCILPPTALIDAEDPSHPKTITHLPTVPCHMFGIVRSIDPVRKVFHLITPETRENLVGVNAFIVGGVKTPKQLVMRESGMGHLPYVDSPQMVQGMPRRRCHQRSRLQNRD